MSERHEGTSEDVEVSQEDVLRFKVKAELRKRMRGVRKTTPTDACTARSNAIIERLNVHPAMISAKRVALFWPIVARHEVDLRPLDASLRARGVRVAYPAIDADTNVMTFRFVDDLAEMEERGYGFMEPSATTPEASLDLVVVPALAIDPQGFRIGYGAGYYDRTIPRYSPPAVTIGVAFDWQLVSEVPVTRGDVAVHHVVTDARTLVSEPPLPR